MIRVRSAREVDLPSVAAVLQDAFAEKMRIVFGDDPAKIRTVLEAVYTGPVRRGYDGVLIAELDGRIVGTLLIEPMDYTPQESSMFEQVAIRQFGLPRMLRAAFLLWLIGHRPAAADAHISDVGVLSDSRGEGVGQQLLVHAEQWARERNCSRLTLWVAATNEPALNLYEKSEFEIVDMRSSWLTRLAYGIRHWYFMEKPLEPLDTSLITYGDQG